MLEVGWGVGVIKRYWLKKNRDKNRDTIDRHAPINKPLVVIKRYCSGKGFSSYIISCVVKHLDRN